MSIEGKMLVPLGSNITVEKAEPVAVSPGGVLYPEVSQKPKDGALTTGKVVGIGAGVRNFYGQKYAPEIQIGEYVMYKNFFGSEFKAGDDKVYVILREADVLGVFRDPPLP